MREETMLEDTTTPAQPPNASVVVRDLRKSFGGQKVLNGLTLQIARGETVAVLGRSGGGKSVLLKLLVGLQSPDSGSIQIAGQEMTNIDPHQLNELRKKIGFLFQQAALYDSLTVEQNVIFPLARNTTMSAEEQKKRARDLLREVGMERDLEKLPSQISGGMQKRVGLARALALDPELLLFDEPTAGLDPITSAEIGDLIIKLKKQRHLSAVVVTHDVQGAKEYSERMVLLHNGAIQAEGTFDELQNNKDEFVSAFLGYVSR